MGKGCNFKMVTFIHNPLRYCNSVRETVHPGPGSMSTIRLDEVSVSHPEDCHVAILMRPKGPVYLFPNYLAFLLKILRGWLMPHL